jgi:hypothetical protein
LNKLPPIATYNEYAAICKTTAILHKRHCDEGLSEQDEREWVELSHRVTEFEKTFKPMAITNTNG